MRLAAAVLPIVFIAVSARAGDALPFKHKVEVYREKDGDAVVFSVLLEQPFFAEEFEKSNYLRLQPLDDNAYLIYPKQTKFHQKHAAFHGRLRGGGGAMLRLSYETVTENLDGSRRVEVREGEIEVPIPTKPGGPPSIYLEWARQQNAHFLNLLSYYPRETFFQYCLLQSHARYGVEPPTLPRPPTTREDLETDLYQVVTGSLAIQQSLQRQTLSGKSKVGDLDHHISVLSPPELKSLPYEKLLEKKLEREHIEPLVREVAKLVPEDHYLLHFHSLSAAGELADLMEDWGGGLLRLLSIHARDHHLIEKFDDQLCLQRDPLTRLFADGVVAEIAITGSDLFFVEGTDVTVILRLKQPAVFEQAARRWLEERRTQCPKLVEREFNHRGHKVAARYTPDRTVSSFVVRHDDYVIFSNSHVAIRRIVDTLIGETPRLFDALDYRYVSTILPPLDDPHTGYFYASEAFLKHQVGPKAKISEKRRVQCFNNLVMLNNASLFYRLEHGRSPESLSDLVEGRFIDADKLVCPHGGTYAFDGEHDTATCSLHNRLKHLTPNAELEVLKVSTEERREYERYKQRYQAFWQQAFDPVAIRISVGRRVKLEVCVLPFANGSVYYELQDRLAEQPQPIDTSCRARSAFVSVGAVVGRERIAATLRKIPGIPEVLAADPTLTDLAWVGERVTLHVCDDDTILEVDPTRLRTLNLFGEISLFQQSTLTTAIMATSLPTYITIDIEDADKARRFLDLLTSKIFLKQGQFYGFETEFDAYRLPDYHGHANYVLSYRLYATKVRLHVALVGERLVAATKLQPLKEVIDAADTAPTSNIEPAHMLVQLNLRALDRFKDDLELYWAERSRRACHGNIMSIYNLIKLYDLPMDEINRLSEAKYGVTYFCPDGGVYIYDPDSDSVTCSVHGNRRNSRQEVGLSNNSSFARLVESLDEINARLRFRDDGLIATLELVRRSTARPLATTKEAWGLTIDD